MVVHVGAAVGTALGAAASGNKALVSVLSAEPRDGVVVLVPVLR
jgi:hypothetical protein